MLQNFHRFLRHWCIRLLLRLIKDFAVLEHHIFEPFWNSDYIVYLLFSNFSWTYYLVLGLLSINSDFLYLCICLLILSNILQVSTFLLHTSYLQGWNSPSRYGKLHQEPSRTHVSHFLVIFLSYIFISCVVGFVTCFYFYLITFWSIQTFQF